MKKVIVYLAAVSLVYVMTGCGESKPTGNAAKPNAAPTTEVKPATTPAPKADAPATTEAAKPAADAAAAPAAEAKPAAPAAPEK